MPLRSGAEALLKRCTKEGGLMQESLLFSGRLAISILLLVLSVALLVGATNNAFIYTRF
jgi:alginate O-acetyltransferase complex protein AlgI